jgi:hypothetical protein
VYARRYGPAAQLLRGTCVREPIPHALYLSRMIQSMAASAARSATGSWDPRVVVGKMKATGRREGWAAAADCEQVREMVNGFLGGRRGPNTIRRSASKAIKADQPL